MVTFGPLLTPTSGHTGLSLDVANIFLVLFERAKASSSLHKMTIPMITSVQIKLTQFANIRIEAFLSFCSRRRTKRNVFAGVRAVSRIGERQEELFITPAPILLLLRSREVGR